MVLNAPYFRKASTIAMIAAGAAMLAVGTVRAGIRTAHERRTAMRPASSRVDIPTAKRALELEIAPSDERGRVTLRFSLPRAGIVRITISTLDGREVGTLASGLSAAGENRLDIDVSAIPPGQYQCTLQTRDGNVSTRLVVVR
jgi:hypothetical protein